MALIHDTEQIATQVAAAAQRATRIADAVAGPVPEDERGRATRSFTVHDLHDVTQEQLDELHAALTRIEATLGGTLQDPVEAPGRRSHDPIRSELAR